MSDKASNIPSPKGVQDPRRVSRAQSRDKPEDMTQTPSEPRLRQPHERDEAADAGHEGTDRQTSPPQAEIGIAHRNIEDGLRDTERRGTPSDVPGSRENRRGRRR